MPGSNLDDGARRAADISAAFLSQPGYSDDSMFFIIRYFAKAEEDLSQADLRGFREALAAMSKAAKDKALSPEERAQRVRDSKAELLERIAYVPELVRDLDQMLACLRMAKERFESK
ncbi:hypothetical protein B0I35DRAFT_440434 [Stachybotrys elegans]|uniref:Uncharacterized protein n=1 Tax=Stachybotrys elegans TaxID=80388 RepID=A0A8K0SJD4_9HYPO|nr:hypothetical protein B0I35DRAFT_440434 [Stachybotrys elegans]